jgi:IMP dehydrogenase
MKEAYSFDDILIRPNYSTIESRSQCDTKTYLTESIILNTPIISANMDTVTEHTMAIKMALLGGVGVIHRYMSVDKQAKEIEHVKHYTAPIIESPLFLYTDDTLERYFELKNKYGRRTFPVVLKNYDTPEKKVLKGIITKRDIWDRYDKTLLVKDVMTPFDKLYTHDACSFDKDIAITTMRKYKIEQLPLVKFVDNFKIPILKGLVTRKDLEKYGRRYPNKVTDDKGTLLVGAAVGVKLNPDRLEPIIKAGVNFLVIDIAHGHHILAMNTLRDLKKTYPDMPIIVGNVGTYEGVKYFQNEADGIKAGIGGGGACRTRVVTGCGVPQFTAIQECSKSGFPYLIADGGITNSGDIVKAIYAGASTVMVGSLLAGTSDSPGKTLTMDGRKVKSFRGMASHEAYYENVGGNIDAFHFHAEGASGYVNYKGDTEEYVQNLLQGFRSGMSYCGSATIQELHEYGRLNLYNEITSNTVNRNGDHGMYTK